MTTTNSKANETAATRYDNEATYLRKHGEFDAANAAANTAHAVRTGQLSIWTLEWDAHGREHAMFSGANGR